RHIAALDVTGFVQASPERGQTNGVGLRRTGAEETNDRHCRLLRARRKRPHRRSAQQRNEIAPPHEPLKSRANLPYRPMAETALCRSKRPEGRLPDCYPGNSESARGRARCLPSINGVPAPNLRKLP